MLQTKYYCETCKKPVLREDSDKSVTLVEYKDDRLELRAYCGECFDKEKTI